MALDKDLRLKISTLVEGAEDVRDLKQELRKLSRTEVPDTTQKFRSGLGDATTMLKGFVGLLAGGALVAGITRATRELEEVNRQARALGESVETVQELRFAFRAFGAEGKDINDALGQIADYALSATQGTESFVDAFGQIGITVEQLRGKSPVELLRLVADGLQQTKDQTLRMATASQLLGDDMANKLLPLLVQGSEKLDDLAEQARDAGAVLGGDMVDAAARSSREFRKLSEIFQAQVNRAVAESSDEFADLAEILTDPATVQGIQNIIGGLATLVGWLATATTKVANFGQAIGETLAAQQYGAAIGDVERLKNQIAAMEEAISKGEQGFRAFVRYDSDAAREKLADLKRRLELSREVNDEQEKAAKQTSGTDLTFSGGLGLDLGAAPSGGGADVTTAAERRAQAIQRIIDKLREQVATTGEASVATEIYKLQQLGAKESTVELAQELLDAAAAHKAKAEAAKQSAKQTQAAKAANDQLITSLQREVELQRIAQEQGPRAAFIERTVGRLQNAEGANPPADKVRELAGSLYDLRHQSQQSADAMELYFTEAAKNIQGALADFLFNPFDKGIKGMLMSFLRMIQRMLAEAAAAQIMKALFGEGFMSGSGGGGLGGIFGKLIGAIFHEGGVVGAGGAATRAVPAAAFAGAPRLHDGNLPGLGRDEVPAILQTGEGVLSREQMAAMGRGGTGAPNIKIVNAIDSSSVVSEGVATASGTKAVLNLIRANKSAVKQVLA